MGSTTTNLGLYKPDRTDYVSVITDINNNMDIIDSSVKTVDERITSEVATLNSRIDSEVYAINTGVINIHTPVLLWQAVNPNVQLDYTLNITAPFNLYNSLDIIFKQAYNSPSLKTMRISLLSGQGTSVSGYLQGFSSITGSSAAIEYYQRPFVINPVGSISFYEHATAVSISSSGVVFSTNDYYCIPYQIWGVDKKV